MPTFQKYPKTIPLVTQDTDQIKFFVQLFERHEMDERNGPTFIRSRPDGCTLIPWRAGRFLAWDVTVPGTLAERYVNLTSKECGLAVARAADEKMKKYGNALPSMEFLPICIEVLGPMDPNTLKFLKEICKMISVRSGDSRELFFATNHISCLLQRFLRVCVLENIQLNADMCN
ncbi:hypothetical protein HELRODRAFT_181038 [Helobdella robusta]|uniref:Uncharacterized protein n=1 Tax=Helobdella robusta TaxID=6412 RepID=T1FGJ7_HELRO|nr:hypothetical protein HELRODRAFT_181038 [Helobdella robusta]ESN93292.1 hypothetical protein HELRODRAFT_181038 [Helobdella robusta]